MSGSELNLSVNIGQKLPLKNPVMTASGTCGYGAEVARFYEPARLGALVLKGISLTPWPGNPCPRITETACGMINSIGLQNVGLKAFIKEKLPVAKALGSPIIANILGGSAGEYVKIARALEEAGVDGIELNVSCPNVKKGGIAFGLDLKSFTKLIKAVRKDISGPAIIVKLSPGAQPIEAFARAAQEEGADAVSLINTVPAMAIDADSRRPLIRNIVGGLSGPAIKPIALWLVYKTSKAVTIPVIGIGGIRTGRDAIEFILAGASAVQVGTASFVDPAAPVRVLEGIEGYMREKGIKDISALVGGLVTGCS
ncbi:MAG: dihydroorotate dehydrogenase [Actinomycetota bacterium]|nr:dihydroorotate dehydrogenase [Actinomycetota bacterium]